MMNLEFIYLFSIRQHPATSPFLKVISIHGAAKDSLSVKGNVFDDDCAPFKPLAHRKAKICFSYAARRSYINLQYGAAM